VAAIKCFPRSDESLSGAVGSYIYRDEWATVRERLSVTSVEMSGLVMEAAKVPRPLSTGEGKSESRKKGAATLYEKVSYFFVTASVSYIFLPSSSSPLPSPASPRPPPLLLLLIILLSSSFSFIVSFSVNSSKAEIVSEVRR
jgi:hypothetical protein